MRSALLLFAALCIANPAMAEPPAPMSTSMENPAKLKPERWLRDVSKVEAEAIIARLEDLQRKMARGDELLFQLL